MSFAQGLLPAFLKLRGRRVVVVGGGPVAAAKVAGLGEVGAEILVVAPGVRPEIEAAALDGRLALLRRAFRADDLDGAWFVIAAAPPEVNREVARAAEARRVFVVAVDDPAACTAYGAATIRRGPVTIAVSTGGDAPALAGLLREGLEALLPEDLEMWTERAREVRAEWRSRGVPMAERRPLLLEALNALYAGRADAPSPEAIP